MSKSQQPIHRKAFVLHVFTKIVKLCKQAAVKSHFATLWIENFVCVCVCFAGQLCCCSLCLLLFHLQLQSRVSHDIIIIISLINHVYQSVFSYEIILI